MSAALRARMSTPSRKIESVNCHYFLDLRVHSKGYNAHAPGKNCFLTISRRKEIQQRGGTVEFVLLEDVQGHEIYINPERVIWVRELPDRRTIISCGHDDTVTVRLSPAQAVAALGVKIR